MPVDHRESLVQPVPVWFVSTLRLVWASKPSRWCLPAELPLECLLAVLLLALHLCGGCSAGTDLTPLAATHRWGEDTVVQLADPE